MKTSTTLLLFLFFIGFSNYAQTNSIIGTITNVKPYFAGEYALTVGKTTLILIVDLKDKTNKSFEVNNEYKDLLIERKGKYILNPKYAHKSLNISYQVNGKGWKCIQIIKPSNK